MQYNISKGRLEDIISKANFTDEGDKYEREYGELLKPRFPNCETYWGNFVIPNTKRIEAEIRDPDQRIRPREGISEDITDIASLHYSMFLNLVYCYEHLNHPQLSSFEDFYMHLVAACDLAEEFLQRTYLLILECKREESKVLQILKREEFLELAGDWYDKYYRKVYDDYLKKGKSVPVRIPNRRNVLDEYFENSEDWMEYKKFTQKIREYRNVIAHDVKIGSYSENSTNFVPKKEKIQQYKKWSDVFTAAQDRERFKRDFIERNEQMRSDIERIEILMNKLWDTPIRNLSNLFLREENGIILEKYNINLGAETRGTHSIQDSIESTPTEVSRTPEGSASKKRTDNNDSSSIIVLDSSVAEEQND